MKNEDTYSNPLVTRYASKDMVRIFSPNSRYSTWRKLWAGLAREQSKHGLDINEEQLKQLDDNINNIDYDAVKKYENDLRHDVMAHVKAFGDKAPKAAGIIHAGATSCFITDNSDLILNKQACEMVSSKIAALLNVFAKFCDEYAEVPCLGWTHFQTAQLTTVGKRATLWAQDLLMDLNDINLYIKELPFRGIKGTTGTQASFLELFDGDFKKVKSIDHNLAKHFGFVKTIPVSGQTYTRKIDEKLLGILSGIASSGAKFASDIRLLMHLREIEEPFGENQIGSSAMAYKRNPMRSERICSLARVVQSQQSVLTQTVSNQWLERTLDDSACRRIAIPEAFMGAEAILSIMHDIMSGVVVYKNRIKNRVTQELPFMATEKIIMECVKRGGDRQEAHEVIRTLSMEVRLKIDEEGSKNDLIERLQETKVFANIKDEIPTWMDPMRFIGACPHQVKSFLEDELNPLVKQVQQDLGKISFEPLSV